MKKDYVAIESNYKKSNKVQATESNKLIDSSSSYSNAFPNSKKSSSVCNSNSFIVEWQLSEIGESTIFQETFI